MSGAGPGPGPHRIRLACAGGSSGRSGRGQLAWQAERSGETGVVERHDPGYLAGASGYYLNRVRQERPVARSHVGGKRRLAIGGRRHQEELAGPGQHPRPQELRYVIPACEPEKAPAASRWSRPRAAAPSAPRCPRTQRRWRSGPVACGPPGQPALAGHPRRGLAARDARGPAARRCSRRPLTRQAARRPRPRASLERRSGSGDRVAL